MTPLKTLTSADFLDRLRKRGIRVSLRPDGRLWLEPKAALTPDLLAEAKAHKDAIAVLLASQNGEASATSSGAPATLDRADEAGGLSEAECRGIAARVNQVLASENEATAARWRRLRQPDDDFNLNADDPSETAAPSPADPTAAVAVRAEELLAQAERSSVIRIKDHAAAALYYRGRAALELAPERLDPTIHRMRPPDWSDPRDEPRSGDRCSACRGSQWWTEGGLTKLGWRCCRCRPPHTAIGVHRVQT